MTQTAAQIATAAAADQASGTTTNILTYISELATLVDALTTTQATLAQPIVQAKYRLIEN